MSSSTTRVFVGSGEGRIHIFALSRDPDRTPKLTPLASHEAGENPSFLAFHPRAPVLYCVDEKSPGLARAFTVTDDHDLIPLGEISSGGHGPAHLSLDETGRVLLLSNYGSGTVCAAHLHEDGSLADPSPPETAGEKAHQIRVDATNRWVFVPCLGTDRIVQYGLDLPNVHLAPSPNAPLESARGSGPRHLDFHPSNRFFWVVHEFGNTITGYTFEPVLGEASALQTVPTLPGSFSGRSDGGGILVHPDGRLLFASNRGHDSIVAFHIEPDSGTLTLAGHTPCGGRHPRHFTLTPDGELLLVANMNSDSLHAFRIDPSSPTALTALGELARVPKPAFVGVRAL